MICEEKNKLEKHFVKTLYKDYLVQITLLKSLSTFTEIRGTQCSIYCTYITW